MAAPSQPDDSRRDSAVEGLAPGFLVGGGRFTLIRVLGRGGMGMVWLAHDEQLHEDVALKFLPPEIRHDAVALDDLRRETARARKLTHPNIIRIHDLYRSDDEAFLSMEYVAGLDLSDLRLKQSDRVFSWDFIEPLVKQLCDALQYAHDEKIVHRDLKPSNMMLDPRGRLKLADFGIAAQVSDSVSRVSMRHQHSGTSTYMSPQQMDGRLPQVTDDIYALGATLYELLTSRPPFYSGDVPHQVRNLAPPPIDERLAELAIDNPVPRSVAAMIMACLAKDPAQRPQSARAVAEWIGLQPATPTSVAAAPITAAAVPPPPEPAPKPPSATRRIEQPVSKSRSSAPAWIIGLALAVVVLFLGAAAAGALWWSLHRVPTDSQSAAEETEFVPAEGVAEGTFATRTLAGHTVSINSIALSPNAALVASASSDGTVVLWDVAAGYMRNTLRSHNGRVNSVAISPDGRWVASGGNDGAVHVWNMSDGSIKATLPAASSNVTVVAFAPGASILAAGDASGEVTIWHADTGSLATRFQAHKGPVRALAFRDSAVLATGGEDKGVHIWNAMSGKQLRRLTRVGSPIDAIAFSPDARLIAITSRDQTLRFWDAQSWQPRRVHKWPNETVHSIAFSPDSKSAAFATESGRVFVWELNGTKRASMEVLRHHTGPAYGVALSKDLVISGGSDALIKLSTYHELKPSAPSNNISAVNPPSSPKDEGPPPPSTNRVIAIESGTFVSLFNGRDLTGWSGESNYWRVADGSIRGEITELRTRRELTTDLFYRGPVPNDFELKLAFRIRGGTYDVHYRATEKPEFGASGYACMLSQNGMANGQIIFPDRSHGGLTVKLGPWNAPRSYKPDAWNELLIRVQGNHIQHWLNDTLVFDATDNRGGGRNSGALSLAIYHTSAGRPHQVEFNHIEIRKLPPPEAAEEVLFNGRDLTGWKGDPTVWSAVDGTIRAQLTRKTDANHPTCLFWRNGVVNDFELRFSFRLTKAGNSGVYYRANELREGKAGGYQFEIMRGSVGHLIEVGNDRPRRDLRRVSPPVNNEDEWHDAVITAVGHRIVHRVDGRVLFDWTDEGRNAPRSGVLAFEATGGPTTVYFRDIKLRRIKTP